VKSKLLALFLIAISSILIGTQLYSQTWTPLTSGTTNILQAISVPSYSVCYVAGYSGTILKTTNGGTSWVSQTTGTTANLADILFTDINTGYAVGDNAVALKTTNGGATWTPLNMPSLPSGIVFRYIYFLNDSTGFISGGIWQSGVYGGYIYKTTNKGASWVQCLSSPATAWGVFYSIFFTSSSVGYAQQASPNGLIFKTTDGGNTWNSTTTNSVNSPGQLFFTTASNGVFTSNTGDIYRTTNGGASWNALTKVTSNPLGGIDFTDANNGYIVGWNTTADTTTLLKTTNGGATWKEELLTPNTAQLYTLEFYKDSVGYMVGKNGTILKYTTCSSSTNNCPNLTATIAGNTYDLRVKTLPKIVFTGNGGTPPYTFSYTINGGSTQTISTITSDTVSINVPFANPTTYTYRLIEVQDSTGCSQVQSDSVTFTITPILSISEANENTIAEIFPNPFGNQLNILVQASSIIKITDISGRELYNNKIETGTSVIETTNFITGIYFITITNNQGTVTKKLIKN